MDLLQKQKVQQNKLILINLEIDIKDTKLSLDQAYQNALQIENSLQFRNQKAECKLAEDVLQNKKQLSIRFGNTYRFIR